MSFLNLKKKKKRRTLPAWETFAFHRRAANWCLVLHFWFYFFFFFLCVVLSLPTFSFLASSAGCLAPEIFSPACDTRAVQVRNWQRRVSQSLGARRSVRSSSKFLKLSASLFFCYLHFVVFKVNFCFGKWRKFKYRFDQLWNLDFFADFSEFF